MKIDLGAKPEKPSTISAKPSNKPYYPSLHVGNIAGVEGLPSGEFDFTGRGRVVHKSVTERDGKKQYSCEIEVQHITPTGGAGGDEEGGLDKALEEIASKKTKKSMKKIEKDEEANDPEDAADGGKDEATEGE